jgi:anti-sigma factor RsiW
MKRTDQEREERRDAASDRELWQRCRTTDVPEDAATRFLDLAAFADGLLDPDETERVAAWLAEDPEAAADVNAARALGGDYPSSSGQIFAGPERIVSRACAIVPERVSARGRIIPLAAWPRRHLVQGLAQWGSIAAGVALAGWLGYAMGTDTSLALSQTHPASESLALPELFDPTATGFLRDLGEGLRT